MDSNEIITRHLHKGLSLMNFIFMQIFQYCHARLIRNYFFPGRDGGGWQNICSVAFQVHHLEEEANRDLKITTIKRPERSKALTFS